MARASKPTTGGGSAELVAEVIGDMTAADFDGATDASVVTVTAAVETSLGTAAHGVLCDVRDGLAAAGSKPPKGLTLRAKHGKPTTTEDGASVDVTFYYGKPTKQTKPEHIGK